MSASIGLLAFATGLLVLVATGAPAVGQSLDDSSFEKWHDYLTPAESEGWRELPWHPSLLDAVADASVAKRPVLLWAMSGHPLGCT